jgi:hypothetical protein
MRACSSNPSRNNPYSKLQCKQALEAIGIFPHFHRAALHDAYRSYFHLSPTQIADFEARYDALLAKGFQTNPVFPPAEPLPKKRGKPKQHPAKILRTWDSS